MISSYSDYTKSLTKNKVPSPENIIKLPDQGKVTATRPIPIHKQSNDNLAEMCNFEPTMHSFTPPDKYFMENLKRRMNTTS